MNNAQTETSSHSSSYPSLDIDSIPSELQALPQFILCKGKRPVDEHGHSLTGWPDKGRPFIEVRELLAKELQKPEQERQFDGVGFMPKANGLMCIDIDHARDPHNNLKPEVVRLIKEIQAHGGWIEQSVSGNVHVWTRGLWPAPKSKKDGVEVFFGSGFVRLTGQPLEGYERGSIPVSPNPLIALRDSVLTASINSERSEDALTFEEFDRSSKLDPLVWTLDRVEHQVIPRLPVLSQDAIKQRAQENAKESTERLRIEILKAHSMLSQTGVKITRTAIKKQVTGKGQTVTDVIGTLIADGHLFESKGGLLKGSGPLWQESTKGDFSI